MKINNEKMNKGLNENLNSLIRNIETILIIESSFTNEIDLFTGRLGMCLFFYQRFLKTSNDVYRGIADYALGKILIKIQLTKEGNLTLSQISSTKFLLSYLVRIELLEDFDWNYASLGSYLLKINNTSINHENIFSLIILSNYINKNTERNTLNDEYKLNIIYEKFIDCIKLMRLQKHTSPHQNWKEFFILQKYNLAYTIISKLFYCSILVRKLDKINFNSFYIQKVKAEIILTIRKYTNDIPLEKYETLDEVNKTYFFNILIQLLFMSIELSDSKNINKLKKMLNSIKSSFFMTGYKGLLSDRQNLLISVAIHSLILVLEASKKIKDISFQKFVRSNSYNLMSFLNREGDIRKFFRLPNSELNIGINGISGVGIVLSNLNNKSTQLSEIEVLLPITSIDE